MKDMRSYIPSLFTLVNLISGSIASVFILEGNWQAFYICFIICLLADLADGVIARLLNATSALGRELDSLADMISFGLVPGLILWQMLRLNMDMYVVDKLSEILLCLPAFLYTATAAVRLAIFNLDSKQTKRFLGLPSPAGAVFIVGLLLIFDGDVNFLTTLLHRPFFIYSIIVFTSYLLVSDLPMFSLKDMPNRFKEGIWLWFGLFLGILVLPFNPILFPCLSVILYIVFSQFHYYFSKAYK